MPQPIWCGKRASYEKVLPLTYPLETIVCYYYKLKATCLNSYDLVDRNKHSQSGFSSLH